MSKRSDNATGGISEGATDTANAGDGTNLSGQMPAGEKPSNAALGNADNDTFHSPEAHASGKDRKLGGQVQPETMLNEADGNRTLMKPRTDPGPVARDGQAIMKMPDRAKGELTIQAANPDGVGTNVVRTSTVAPHFAKMAGVEVTEEHTAQADLIGHGGASDQYNPEGRENTSLTQRAMERAAEAREIAPQNP